MYYLFMTIFTVLALILLLNGAIFQSFVVFAVMGFMHLVAEA